MKMKDRKGSYPPLAHLFWRAFLYLMHLHENHYTKRAGVAGLRAHDLMLGGAGEGLERMKKEYKKIVLFRSPNRSLNVFM